MASSVEEWFRQADYDLDTAEYMLAGGRTTYAVFMAHLAVEKALKGLYLKRLQTEPPRTHNLMMSIQRMGLKPPAGTEGLLLALTQAQRDTRYGDDLKVLQARFTSDRVQQTLDRSREMIRWTKSLL